MDIPVHKKINPTYILKYLKDINYRNYFSSHTISFELLKPEKYLDIKWIENENYRGIKTQYIVNYNQKQFYIIYYQLLIFQYHLM